LMLGSMRVLWPWPAGTETTAISAPSGDVAMPIVLAAVAFAVVLGVDRVARRRPADRGYAAPASTERSMP
ncbi:MAG: hypothetical protein ACO4BZ_07010, partial [Ilumatobacteraceae bacterium]